MEKEDFEQSVAGEELSTKWILRHGKECVFARAHRYRTGLTGNITSSIPQLTGRDLLIEAGKECPEH